MEKLTPIHRKNYPNIFKTGNYPLNIESFPQSNGTLVQKFSDHNKIATDPKRF